MEVSHFELLFKSQAPADPQGGPSVQNVLQGYFLKITNLEEFDLTYGLEFVTVPPLPGQPERGLAGNTLCILDTPPGTDNQFGQLTERSAGVFRPDFPIRVPANGTALVAVLPDIFPGSPDMDPIVDPTFEVRGFVRISLPALLERGESFFASEFVPQSETPVKVMLTPQNRASFFDGPTTITEQLQTGLPNASGAAINMIPPDPGGPLVIVSDFEEFDASDVVVGELVQQITPIELAQTLMAVNPKTADLRGFNRALKKMGAGVKLEKV